MTPGIGGAIATSMQKLQGFQQSQQGGPAQEVANTQQGAAPPTPPTGLDQQLSALNQQYEAVRNLPDVGYDERTRQLEQAKNEGMELQSSPQGASTNLNSMARQMAENYGLPIGRGSLVDENGQFTVTPDQLAAASGGTQTQGEVAAKMNFISQALAEKQKQRSQEQAISTMQAGLGQVQSRGRGSLAAMQSGMYQGLAQLYANREFDTMDFSYFIQKEQLDMADQIMRRQEKLAKKQARTQTITGIGILAAGIITVNPALIVGGAATAGGNAGSTGWF